MARIFGVDLPSQKRIEAALTYIYGIGAPRASQILRESGVSPDTRVKDLKRRDRKHKKGDRVQICGRGYSKKGSVRQHKETYLYRVLSWNSSQKGTSCKGATNKNKCTHKKGTS